MSIAEPEANNEFFAEFLDDYFAECDEHLTAVRRDLLALESFVHKPVTDRALVDDLFRSFHSLKGISAMVGVREAEQLAHHMESYLRDLRQGQIALTAQGLDALVAGTKVLDQVVSARRASTPPPDIALVIDLLTAITSDGGAHGQPPLNLRAGASLDEQAAVGAGGGKRVWRFEFTPSPTLAERGVNVNSVRARLQALGEVISAAPRVMAEGGIAFEFLITTTDDESTFAGWRDDGLSYALQEQAAPAPSESADGKRPGAAEKSAATRALPAATSSVVRVSLSRLDELMRMVGELVISRARLDDQVKSAEEQLPAQEWRQLQETNQLMERQLRDLREGVMRVRMVPVREIFERMQFVVRDLAREHSKRIKLQLSGQETEIDKLLVERMMDPLLHLVRNAVSHGLETPREREAAGKPAEGTISLRASTAGEMVVIEVEDDGRGIDRERVAARAEAMGLIAAGQADDSETWLLDLICSPGFSTREEADRASGRGIGMAVAKNTVEALGGLFTLATEVGKGTRFTIELPVTLAIADALIVSVGGQRFAVPLSAVREVIEVEAGSLKAFESNEVISYRGGVLPIVRLARVFGLGEDRGRAFHVFIVGAGLAAVGIAVDRILGQREIVVRAISDPLIQVAGISGATELDDGRAVLILDAAGLVGRKRLDNRV